MLASVFGPQSTLARKEDPDRAVVEVSFYPRAGSIGTPAARHSPMLLLPSILCLTFSISPVHCCGGRGNSMHTYGPCAAHVRSLMCLCMLDCSMRSWPACTNAEPTAAAKQWHIRTRTVSQHQCMDPMTSRTCPASRCVRAGTVQERLAEHLIRRTVEGVLQAALHPRTCVTLTLQAGFTAELSACTFCHSPGPHTLSL